MPNDNIVELKTRDELATFIKKHPVVILKFTATWCGPCKRIASLVKELFSEMPSNVFMVVIDIDKARDIASYLNIKSVPTMCNYVKGEPMDSVIGSNSEKIISFFKKTAARTS